MYARRHSEFERLRLDAPTIEVDTTAGCRPGLREITDFVNGHG